MNYYVEDHENGPLRANGAGGPPRTDKQPLLVSRNAARRAWLANGEDSRRCDYDGCVYVEGMTAMCRACFGVFCFSHLRNHGCGPDVAAPLTSGGHPNNNAPGRRKEDDENLVAFHPTQDPISGPISHALGSEESGSGAVAYPLARRGRDGDSHLEMGEANVYNSLRAGNGGSSRLPQVLTPEAMVRRLTPVECARLQGLPDDWFDGVPGTSDSKMYAGLGDAVTVNVAEWIGRRIASAA